MTVVELMVSALLMGLTMAAVGELVVVNTYSATRLTNATDGQYGCSRAIRRIGEDVRISSVIVTSLCTAQTLVLQQPAYYNDQTPADGHSNLDGFPLLTGAGSPTSCLDTVTYQVVPDPTYANVYQLQVTRTPGVPETTYPTITRPALQQQVVLSGLVGPLPAGGSGPPAVFQYLTSNNVATFPPGTPPTPTVGVFVDFEVQSPASGLGVSVRHSGAHIETYLKCAVSAKQTNQ
jgi:hypothetical protein